MSAEQTIRAAGYFYEKMTEILFSIFLLPDVKETTIGIFYSAGPVYCACRWKDFLILF